MHVAPQPTAPRAEMTVRLTAAARWRRQLVAGTIAAIVLVMLGLGGGELIQHGSDLPRLPELAADAHTVYAHSGSLLRDHAPLVAGVKRATVALNGQIDARVPAYVALVLNVAGFAFVGLALRRAVRVGALVLLDAVALAAAVAPAIGGLLPLTTWSAATPLIVLGATQIVLMNRQSAACWWAGAAVGVIATALSSAGLAASVAILGSMLVQARQRRSRDARRLVGIAAVVIGGTALVIARTWIAGAALSADTLGRWPIGTLATAPLLWLPALACVGGAIARRPVSATLVQLALWAFCSVAVLAFTGAAARDAGAFLIVVLVINAACWAGWPTRSRSAHVVRLVAAASWGTLVAVALLRPANVQPRSADEARAQTTALAEAVRTGADHSATMPGTAGDRHALMQLANDRALRPILPASVRPVLPLISNDGDGPFQENAAPALAEREGLPFRGSWTADGNGRTGEWISAPLASSFPRVQLRIGGTLRPPATSLCLRTPDGRDIAPLTGPMTATARWRRVNFTTPGGPFQIVARTSEPANWLAFTALVEVGPLTGWLAKVPAAWPIFPLWTGLVLGAAVALVAVSRLARATMRVERRAWHVLPWVALFGYGLFFAQHLDPTAGPNDSGGYLNSAKLMVGGALTAAPRSIFGPVGNEADVAPYLPITFHALGTRMVPEYPVGWPLEVALFGRLFGLAAGVPLLILLQLLLGVVVTQRLARLCGLPEAWAWFAAAAVALSPVYLFEALQPVSDGPALLWVGAAVYWAWLSRDRPGYAVLSGLATALAVMIRPSNLLAVVPLLICLFGHWRQLVWWAVSGVPGAAWLAWYQHRLYGNWHTTGYGDISSGFGWHFAPLTLRSYATWLPELLTPLVLLGFGLPFIRTTVPRVRLLLVSWVAVFLAFYAVYWCTWDNWYNMRFVLPAFPPMMIAALLTARELLQRHGARWLGSATRIGWAGIVVAGLALGFLALRTAQRNVTYWMHSNHTPGDAARWAGSHLPPDAVVFAKHMTGSLFYYSDLTFVRLDHPLAQDPAFHARIAQTGRPIYAITVHWETRGYTWSGGKGSGYPDLPGSWDPVTMIGDHEVYVWRKRDTAAASTH